MDRRLYSPALIVTALLLFTACDQQTDHNDGAVTPSSAPDDARVAELQQHAASETAEQQAARLLATFPAQQRQLAAPEQISHGEGVYGINCRSCHGSDLRGGDLGGPNLLRSEVVLKDQNGELIGEVVTTGRNNPGQNVMPPLPLSAEDIEAVSAYIHSIVAQSRGQGSPPPGEEIELDILVGNAREGEEFFQAQCSGCHSVTGDLAGIASQISSPESLQDSWIAGRRRGAPPNPDADPSRREVRVTVTLSNGDSISGVLGRRDDFIISLTTDEGSYRSFTLHENTDPGVVDISIIDPMARHRELLSEITDDIMHNVTAYLVTLK